MRTAILFLNNDTLFRIVIAVCTVLVVFLHHSTIHQIFFMKNGEIALTQSPFFAGSKGTSPEDGLQGKIKGEDDSAG